MLALAGASLPIHGSGAAPRGYMYVSDAAAAYDVILHRGEAGEVRRPGRGDSVYSVGGWVVVAGGGRGRGARRWAVPTREAGHKRPAAAAAGAAGLARRLLLLTTRPPPAQVYNIGGRTTLLTPLQIATDVRHYFGLPPERVVHVAERPFRDKRWALPGPAGCCGLLRWLLGLAPAATVQPQPSRSHQSPAPPRSPAPRPAQPAARRYLTDDAKLAALGWRERVGWRQGLERTIGWYAQLGGRPGYWRDEGALRAALRSDGAAEAAEAAAGGVGNGVGHQEGGGE
jgi:nucleoside-diphosphate-sugar epimerase